GLSTGRRKAPGGEHRCLRRRAVVEQSVNMPADRGLQVFGGRILPRVERDLEDDLLRAIRALRSLRNDLAEVPAERDLFFVVEPDLGEQQDAETFERLAAFARERGVEHLLTTHYGLRSDARRQRNEAVGHEDLL